MEAAATASGPIEEPAQSSTVRVSGHAHAPPLSPVTRPLPSAVEGQRWLASRRRALGVSTQWRRWPSSLACHVALPLRKCRAGLEFLSVDAPYIEQNNAGGSRVQGHMVHLGGT